MGIGSRRFCLSPVPLAQRDIFLFTRGVVHSPHAVAKPLGSSCASDDPAPWRPASEQISARRFDGGYAHERLHHGDERPSSKTVRETEAEAVAFVVCRAIGLDTNSAASDYIQMYDGKPDTLAASLDRVQHVAAEIIAAVQASDETPTVE